MKQTRFLLFFLFIFLNLVFVSGQGIMPLGNVKPGDKGYGLSVFRGTQVEKFEYEVIGVFDEGGGALYILVELSGGPKQFDGQDLLKNTRIISGMSGSPIYTNDGKLVGAISMAPRFAKEVKGFVTPIELTLGFKPKILSEPNKLIFEANAFGAISFSDPPIKAGEMYVFCDYWGYDYSCAAGTVTMVDRLNGVFYALGHESGPNGLMAIPFWKGNVLTTFAKQDSSNKVVTKIGPMLGAVVFGGPYGQIAKFGAVPKFFPLTLSLENYFLKTDPRQYFFAYTPTTGSSITSIIQAQKALVDKQLDIDVDAEINISGLGQVKFFGLVGKNMGQIPELFITDSLNPVIDSIRFNLRVKNKYKRLALQKVTSECRLEDDKVSVDISIVALGEKEWTLTKNLKLDKKYLEKKIFIASGEELANQILPDLLPNAETVELLNKVSDRNALYVYYASETPLRPRKPFDGGIFLIGLQQRGNLSDLQRMSVGYDSQKIEQKTDNMWKESNPKPGAEIIAKLESVGGNYLIEGKKDFTVKISESEDTSKETKKRKRFILF